MSAVVDFIGVDIGCRSFSAAIVGCKPRDFEHSPEGVSQLLSWARKYLSGELRAACESSGPYSLRFAMLAAERGLCCAIVPPQRVRANAQALGRRSKTDRIDAQVILDFAMHAQPRPWTAPPPELQQLAALAKAREDCQVERKRWANRCHALEQSPQPPLQALELARRMQELLKAERKTLLRAIKRLLAENQELQERFELLQSIPGVGPEIALAVLIRSEIFLTRSDKQLTAYAGLAPQHRQSGSSLRGRSQIGRSGDKRLRTLLYMGSLKAASCNPPLQSLYQRLRQGGKKPTPAHIAVARRLLLQIRSVLRSGQPFFNPESRSSC